MSAPIPIPVNHPSQDSSRRVECPGCGKRVAVRKDGLLWHHNTGKPEWPGSGRNAHCRRSGTDPAGGVS